MELNVVRHLARAIQNIHATKRQAAERRLRYYRIGLGVIGILTLSLALFTILISGNARLDAKTAQAAKQTVDSLNEYISDKQKLPDSLEAADIHPDSLAITYKKESETKFTFCASYKAASTSYIDTLSDFDSLPPATSSYLYVSSYHKKGDNCQTVEPYMLKHPQQYTQPSYY